MDSSMELAKLIADKQWNMVWVILVIFIIGFAFYTCINVYFTNRATERIKSELAKSNIAYQIKLSTYHNKEFEALEMLYKQLWILQIAVINRISNSDLDAPEHLQNFRVAYLSTDAMLKEKSIYLDDDLATKLEGLLLLINRRIIGRKQAESIRNSRRNNSIWNDKRYEEIMKKKDGEFYDFLDHELEESIQEIRNAIKTIVKP